MDAHSSGDISGRSVIEVGNLILARNTVKKRITKTYPTRNTSLVAMIYNQVAATRLCKPLDCLNLPMRKFSSRTGILQYIPREWGT